MNPIAKYKLHATRVDRIAIVDRPAVPDAEVLVYKRFKDDGVKTDLEKKVVKIDDKNPEGVTQIDKSIPIVRFNTDYMIKATESAVDVLQDGFFYPFYTSSEMSTTELQKYWDELFGDFQFAVVDILKRIAKKVKAIDDNKLTNEEMVANYRRSLKMTLISEAFSHLRNNLTYLMFGGEYIENPEEALVLIIADFKAFVEGQYAEIYSKRKTDPQALEKVGRKISYARMKELQKAVEVLTLIINEQGSEVNKIKEAEDMDIEQLMKKLEDISVKVDGITGDVALIKTAFKDANIPLTEAEKTAKAELIEADKKAELEKAEKLKADKIVADKKLSDEAIETEKADIEKRRVALALKEGATQEDIEKAEKENADKVEKFKNDLPNKIEGIEKALGEFKKFVETVGKRFGIKTSMDVDLDKAKEGSDPFGNALRN